MEQLIEKKARELVEGIPQETPDIKFDLDTSKSYGEQAKEAVDFMATKNAIADEQLGVDLTEKKKEELKTSAEAKLQKEKAKAKQADVEMQSAEYESFSGVATYAGIKKPLPKKMQKVLFTTLSFFQMIWLIVTGIPTSMITITADAVDNIFTKLSNIAKSSRIFVITLFCIAIVLAIGYVFFLLLQKYNIIG
mgnify:CR=1 FL=1